MIYLIKSFFKQTLTISTKNIFVFEMMATLMVFIL